MSRSGDLGRWLRTLRHLGPSQAAAQALHAVRGIRRPPAARGQAPELSRGEEPANFLPAPRHARWLSQDELELIRRRVNFAHGIDWGYGGEGPLWAYHLHQCDHLRSPDLEPGRRLALMLDWVRNHREGIGWDPHPTSLRLFSWGKNLLTPGALGPTADESRELRASLAVQLDSLDRNLEVRLRANHLLTNLSALVFGGLLFEGPRADRWLAQADRFAEELAAQFGADGAHEERSPMYHALLLENLLDLVNLARVRPGRIPARVNEALDVTAGAALGALSVWRHPDGEIALFGDSAHGIAHAPDTLLAYGRSVGVDARPPSKSGLLDEGGFARLEGGPFSLLVSIAGPAPAHQPGHAHCDALAFELLCGGERVVCDTGVHDYLPGERRRLARATLSHATLEVGGEEQAEIWAAHRVGGRPRVELVDFRGGTRLEATCASWSTPDTLHRRSFLLSGGALEIRDALEGHSRPGRFALPLAPGLEPLLSVDPDGGGEARIPLADGRRLRVVLPATARWRVERTPYYPEFGHELERVCLVGEADRVGSAAWRFECEG